MTKRSMVIGSQNSFEGMADTILKTSSRVDSATIVPKEKGIQVNWLDGRAIIFNGTWLRVNCSSNIHFSGQKIKFSGDFLDATPSEVSVSDDSRSISVHWTDGHASEFESKWLRLYDNSASSMITRTQGSWPTALRSWEAIPTVSFSKFMDSDEGVYELLRNVNNSGICVLKGCGDELGSVKSIAKRISPTSHTMLYGDMFNVITEEKPVNIAYTNERLRLHQDLVYYESPPGLQLLHCIKFGDDVEGGESLYMDIMEAALQFGKKFPDEFKVLTSIPATFQKNRNFAKDDIDPKKPAPMSPDGKSIDLEPMPKDGYGITANETATLACYMTYHRPHIQLDKDDDITAVFWAPMFEGVLYAPNKALRQYYKAYSKFQMFIESGEFASEYTLKRKMRVGECVVFNNRRMVHGREEIRGNGVRHLQGCYTNIDDSLSRYITLQNKQGKDDGQPSNVKRWGNGSIPFIVSHQT